MYNQQVYYKNSRVRRQEGRYENRRPKSKQFTIHRQHHITGRTEYNQSNKKSQMKV
jgi:hypothetical protein